MSFQFWMRYPSQMSLGITALLMASLCQAQTARRWDFDRSGDRENWTVQADGRGVVMGGSVWLTLAPKETNPENISNPDYQVWGGFLKFWKSDWTLTADQTLMTSPSSLNLSAAEVTQVRMRVLNLSSLTDFYLRWRTKENGWGRDATALTDWGQPEQSRRCTMQADRKVWQEITCYVDQRWQGTIEQIAILSGQWMLRGSVWIDWIEIGKAPSEPVRSRPDLASVNVIPTISVPGVSQEAFVDAFKVLDENLVVDVPIFGFNYPVVVPGPYYAKGGWWHGDSTIALDAAKWTSEAFAEDVIRGFIELQAENPDGRIDFMGKTGIRGQVADVASFPAFYFETSYDIARRTRDQPLREQIFESMRKYLDWWLSPVKRDEKTGLVSALFEETGADLYRAPNLTEKERGRFASGPMALAPTDLNVAIAVGAARTAELASSLGKVEDEMKYRAVFQELSRSINEYLWDDKDGVYYNYDLPTRQRRPLLNVSMFHSLRMQIAPASRRDRLLKRLLDPSEFNWGKIPLTTVSMKDPAYVDLDLDHHSGDTDFGSVRTIWNVLAFYALNESNLPELAAELNWKTIQAFQGKYNEFLSPSTGKGLGGSRFTWAAAQYIQSVVDHLFGIDVDNIRNRLTISPHIPRELYGRDLAIERLKLPMAAGDTRLSVAINQSSARAAKITVRISEPLPEGSILVALPCGSKQITVPVQPAITAEFP